MCCAGRQVGILLLVFRRLLAVGSGFGQIDSKLNHALHGSHGSAAACSGHDRGGRASNNMQGLRLLYSRCAKPKQLDAAECVILLVDPEFGNREHPTSDGRCFAPLTGCTRARAAAAATCSQPDYSITTCRPVCLQSTEQSEGMLGVIAEAAMAKACNQGRSASCDVPIAATLASNFVPPTAWWARL